PPLRFVYNTAVYGLSGAAAGLVVSLGVDSLPLAVVAASAAFYTVNVGLVAMVVARVSRRPFVPLVRKAAASTAVPLAIMASVALMLAILWERSPFYAAS